MSTHPNRDIIEPSIDPKTRKLAYRDVVGQNDAQTRTQITVRRFAPFSTDEPNSLGGGDTSPSPIETLLGALVGCEGVIIHGVASAIGFEYTGVSFQCRGQIDVRGPKGVPGVRPYFERVELTIVLATDEPLERLEKLKVNVEFRCPIVNLLRAAGVDLEIDWQTMPVGSEPDITGHNRS